MLLLINRTKSEQTNATANETNRLKYTAHLEKTTTKKQATARRL
jgi:hypothetical protein